MAARRTRRRVPTQPAYEHTPVEPAVVRHASVHHRGPLVGRDDAIRCIVDAVERGERLVTLVGPGGVGKTRLALAAAAALAADAVYFCDASEARSDDELCRALGRTIGVAAGGGSRDDATARLGHALAARGRALVVLDNLEQVIGPAAQRVSTWLVQANEVRFLATSREGLRIAAEMRFDVPPLALGCAATADGVPSDAAKLFIDRVQSARACPAPTVAQLAAIESLVAALDGLPLAIELAASRALVLAPEALLERISRDGFGVLAHGARDAPGRHRSLERALDVSWNLLTAPEQTALARCGVFQGGADMEAIAAVLDVTDGTDLVQSLCEKSLLRRDADEARFTMYASVRDYALGRLEARGNVRETREKHARWFVRYATALAREVDGHAGRARLDALVRDADNVTGACEWALREAAGGSLAALELALQGLVAFDPVVQHFGARDAQIARLDAALSHPHIDSVAPRRVFDALRARGRHRATQGRSGAAMEDHVRLLEIARRADDATMESAALAALSVRHCYAGDLPAARRSAEASLDLVRSTRDLPRGSHLALSVLAMVDHFESDLASARARYESLLTLHREADDLRALSTTLGNLGFLLQDLGELERAESCYQQSLALDRALGRDQHAGQVLGYCGNLARRRRRSDEAEARYGEALAVMRAIGDRRFEGVFLMDLAVLRIDHGDLDGAEVQLQNALGLFLETRNPRCEHLTRGYLAAVHAAHRDLATARALLDEAAKWSHDAPDPTVARVIAMHEGTLAVASAHLAKTEGRIAEAHVSIARARACLDAAPTASGVATEHEYFARRWLTLALEREAPPADAVLIARDGAWFRPAGAHATRVDLATRAPLRRVLAALVAQHLASPGEALATGSLGASGWPGERIQRAALQNRVRVAIATLRRMGLGEAIVRSPRGYSMDRTVPLHVT